jgi:hypothetical protein
VAKANVQPVELPTIQPAKPPSAPKQAPKPLDAQTPKRSSIKRQDGRELRKMTLYLKPDLARALAVKAAETGEDMSQIVSDALGAWLKA